MVRKKTKEKKATPAAPVLPPLEFKPKAEDSQQAQGVLIACRNMEQYGPTVMLVAMAINGRAEQIMFDFTVQGCAVRFRIDGLWEKMPPMDRATGDGLAVILKRMCMLNFQDRRSRQVGKLPLKFNGVDWILEFMSQGTPNGERALVTLVPKKPVFTTLESLGMRAKMQEQFKSLINGDDSLFVFSGPPGHGMPTTFRTGLEAADRFVRDFHIIEDEAVQEPEMINITQHTFNAAAGETPMNVLKGLLLKQPDALVMPNLGDGDVVKLLCEEILEEHRYVVTRTPAGSAVEAFLKLLSAYRDSAKPLAKATCGVINQRLIRRLCPQCRQGFQPSPQLLQKLGIPPGRVPMLYQPFVPPPPEQRVDANGKPIEIPICNKCNGRGYFGRAAIFELLTVNDEIRQAALSNPTPAAVLQVARAQGFLTIQEEGVLAVATGLTSLQELQRVLAGK